MVKRNTTKEFDFYVYTDNLDLYPEDHFNVIPHTTSDVGWWCKVNLFKPGVLPEGEYVYFDLDVIIVDNIDEIFDYDTFAIIRDFIRPDEGLLPGPEYNSSIMKFDVRKCSGIYEFYHQNREAWKKYQEKIHFFGDQVVISQYVNHYPDFCKPFPDQWSSSFKKGPVRKLHNGDRSEWFGRKLGKEKVVVFHGDPSPADIINDKEKYLSKGSKYCTQDTIDWIEKYWITNE